MPKTKPLTKEEQEKQEREAMAKRVRTILAPHIDGIPLYEVAHLAGIKKDVFYRRWHGEVDWELRHLRNVCNALGVQDFDRARLVGGVKK